MMQMPMDIAPSKDRKRRVVLLDDFLPQVVRRELVDDDKRAGENHDADGRVDDGIYELVTWMPITCLLCSGGSRCKRNDTSRDCHERTWEHSSLLTEVRLQPRYSAMPRSPRPSLRRSGKGFSSSSLLRSSGCFPWVHDRSRPSACVRN